MTTHPVTSPQLILNDDPEAPSVLMPQTGQLFILNRVGKRILELANGSRDLDAIAQVLTEEFTGADLEYVLNKVQAFLQQSTEKGIVTWT